MLFTLGDWPLTATVWLLTDPRCRDCVEQSMMKVKFATASGVMAICTHVLCTTYSGFQHCDTLKRCERME